jgi:hypothetical protein
MLEMSWALPSLVVPMVWWWVDKSGQATAQPMALRLVPPMVTLMVHW